AAGEALEEGAPEQVHVPGADDKVDAAPGEPLGHGGVAGVAVRVVVELEDGGGDPGLPRPLEGAHARVVARDRDDRQARVDQRLQVRTFAADQDADHASLPMTSAPLGASGTTAHMTITR